MPDHPTCLTIRSHARRSPIPAYAQRHAYLTNRLGKFIDVMASQADGLDSISSAVSVMGDSAYDVLCALIPNLSKRVPKWEFAGYGSAEAYEQGEYDENEDKSPTFPEIVEAFEIAVRVNRFDVFKALGSLVDPKMLKAELSLWISDRLSGSESSPSISAGSEASESSGTTAPTSEDSSEDAPPEPSTTEEYVRGRDWMPRSSGALQTTSA
jgi:hypothetical protein